MPVAVAVLEILDTLAQKLADRLFEGFTSKVDGSLERREVQAAKGRVVVQVFDSVQAFFQAEMKEDDAVLLAGQCLAVVEKVDFSPKTFAQHGYDPQKVSEWLLAQYPPDRDTATLQLSSAYSRLLLLVSQRLCDLAHLLPEWERANWELTFVLLKRIEDTQKQQTELMKELQAALVKRRQPLEAQYCRFLERELSEIEVKGVRGVAEVLSLSLGTAYTELKLARRLEPPRKAQEKPDAAELADLESVRKELERFRQRADALEGQSVGEILAESRRVVIVGEPGSGKTTLLQRLALLAAQGQLGRLHAKLGEPLVPFLFPVRSLDFSKLPAASDFLAACAPSLQFQKAGATVEDVLRHGRGLILLDGLDECQVPPEAEMRKSRPDNELTEWDRVVRWVQGILKAFPETRMVVSSRPSGYTWGLLKETGFSEAEIQQQIEEDGEQFVRQWCLAALRYKAEARGPEAEALGRDAEARAADLLRRIERTPSVHLLARTPLMLAVLCTIHHYRGQSLPERRVELLKECVDVLLYEWRKAHGLQKILGDLDAGRQRGLLQPLAWAMLQEGKAEFPRSRVEEIFRNHLPDNNLSADRAPEILDMIRDRTGVLIERRPGVFAFAHIILQEYLAAEEAAQHDPDILLWHAEDPAWREVIPLAIGCHRGAQETFIRSLRDKGHVALAARCVASAERVEPGLREGIVQELAEEETFSPEHALAFLELGHEVPRPSVRDSREQQTKLEAWKSLSARVVHRIGNQLFAVRGTLRLLRGGLAEKDSEAVSDAEAALDRIEEFLEEFRTFSGVRPPQFRPTNLVPVLRETVGRFSPSASQKGVELVCDVPDSLPSCQADLGQLDTCLGELLENAIRHAPGNSQVKVVARATRTEGRVGLQITVEDRGPGVPYGDKRRIFEPFVSTQPGGTGLGLAIVAQIVNNHRGTVRETGIPGSGARFVIDLPAQTSQESPDGSDGNR